MSSVDMGPITVTRVGTCRRLAELGKYQIAYRDGNNDPTKHLFSRGGIQFPEVSTCDGSLEIPQETERTRQKGSR